MKKITNKNLTQKIIIAIIMVLSFNFIMPTYSRADIGGQLFSPLVNLFATVADAVMGGLQYFMYNGDSGFGIELFNNGFMKQASKLESLKSEYPDLIPKDSDNNGEIEIYASDLDRGWIASFFSWVSGTTVLEEKFGIPIITYSPERIFAGQVPSLDINFINPHQWDDDAMNEKSITQALQQVISSWYVALRNLAIVGLLSVLLYVGIRMIISSTSSDKAKYKQMLMDWVVSLCIIFFLHYIMSFTLTITQIITDGINGKSNSITITVRRGNEVGNQVDDGTSGTHVNPGITSTDSKEEEDNSQSAEEVIAQFNTDLMGAVRFQIQYANLGKRVIYLIMYIALVVYTVMFTWKYVKRAITMAFLTLMAPLVALTYPIDKMGDGKSQAFNMCLKEYIFSALLQPFHLILYTIFLGSAMHIAANNPIYAILFLAFITPAEKLLRKFFGFEKAATVGALDSAAKMFGGATAFKMVSGMMKKGAGLVGKGANAAKNGIGQFENRNSPSGVDGFTSSTNNSRQESNNESQDNNQNPEIEEENTLRNELDNADYNDMFMNPDSYRQKQERLAELERKNQQEQRNQEREQSGQTEQNQPQIRVRRLETPPPFGIGQQQPTQSQTSQNTERETIAGRVKRGIQNKASSTYKDKLTNKRWWAQQGIKAAKFAGKTAIRAGSAATMAAVGLGMGIAGDDLEDVVAYGMAGATLGATAGGNIALKGANAIGNQVQDIWYGSHEEALEAQQTRKNRFDSTFIESVQENYRDSNGEMLHGKELNMAVDRAAEYYNYGITDSKKIAKTMKLEDKVLKDIEINNTDMKDEERKELAKTRATTISKLADSIDDKYLRKPENVKNLKESLKKSIIASGMDKNEADKNANEMIRELKIMKKVD